MGSPESDVVTIQNKTIQQVNVTVLVFFNVVCFHLQSIVGLDSFHHRKVGKKSELTLVWTAEDLEKPPVEQVRTLNLHGFVRQWEI